MIQSGIPFNIQEGTDRQYKMLNSYLELVVNQHDGGAGATRKIDKTPSETGKKESALNQAQKLKQKEPEVVTIHEQEITAEDLKQK